MNYIVYTYSAMKFSRSDNKTMCNSYSKIKIFYDDSHQTTAAQILPHYHTAITLSKAYCLNVL